MSHPSGRIVIAGGSGFLGTNLGRHLAELGYEVVLVSRKPPRGSGPWRHIPWDGHSIGEWSGALDGASGLVNLAGRTVDCIKTPDHRDEILRSRVEATEVLGKAVRLVTEPPPVWVQMSTAHIYGDPPERVCEEGAALGSGLAPFVAREWEAAFARAALPTMRQVVLRTSFVLGRHGGALPRLVKLARFGFGGKAGHGRQGVSWLHQKDMNRIFERALASDAMHGVYIASAPKPVSNAEFMRELRGAIGATIGLPAAGWMVRIGAPLFLRTDPELGLYGRYCVPRRLTDEGFACEFADLRSAFADLYA